MIICQIREFIRKHREIRERVVAKDITILLRSLGYLEFFPDDSLIMNNAVSYVQRYMVFKGFCRGTKKGSHHYRLKSHILEKENEYVRHMMKENVARQHMIVHMYDSYIHKNYYCYEESMYDPN